MATQKQNRTTEIVPVAAKRKKIDTDIALKLDAAQRKGPWYKSDEEKIMSNANIAHPWLTRNMVYWNLLLNARQTSPNRRINQ